MENIKRRLIEHQSVDNLLVLTLFSKRSKHTIPNNEHSTVVFIQTVNVAPMMDPMMFRRVEDELQRAQRLDCLRVYPELVEQIKLLVSNKMGWRYN